MVGVEDQRDIERPGHVGLGDLTGQQVQGVGGERQPAARGERLLSRAQALERAEHRRQLGDEPHRLAVLRRPAVVAAIGVHEHRRAHRRAQHVHRVRGGGRVLDDAMHYAVDLLGCFDLCGERLELRPRRQLAVEEQIGRLLERRVVGEIVDVVPPVDQAAFVTEDGAHRRFGGDDAFEALRGNAGCRRRYHFGRYRLPRRRRVAPPSWWRLD